MDFDRTSYINLPVPIESELKILFDLSDALTIFEIGACEGEDSIKYARLFPNAKIYAFEPLPDNVRLMARNYENYHIKNISWYNLALSSDSGEAEFFVSEGRPENMPQSDWDFGNKSSSLLPPDKHLETLSFVKFTKKIVVKTITLKSFCEANNIQEIDFIHMDVQGAELMVLEGAGSHISRIKAIWLEVSKLHLYKGQPLVDDVDKFMRKYNFVLVKDSMDVVQGDRLYISKTLYRDYKNLCSNGLLKQKSLIRRILSKVGW